MQATDSSDDIQMHLHSAVWRLVLRTVLEAAELSQDWQTYVCPAVKEVFCFEQKFIQLKFNLFN